jgi:hypothetical protein
MPSAARRFLLAACLAAATACGGTAGGHSAASAPPPDQAHVWLSFAACLREHGANEPDPTFDQSGSPQWSVDPKTLPPAATQACGSLLQSAHLQRPQSAPTAARLAALARYAQCLREHGVPDFPDPDPQTGSYPTTSDPTREPDWTTATRACQQLAPPGGKASS